MTFTHSAPLPFLRRAAFSGQWWLALLLFVLPGLASAQAYTPPGTVSYVPTVQAGTPFTISFNGIPADAQYTLCWEGENLSGPCDTFGNPGGQTPVVVLTHVYLVPGRPFPIISEVQPNANRNAQILAEVTVTSPPPVLTLTPANASLQQPVVADARPLDPNLTYTLDWGDGLTDTITGVTEVRNEHFYSRADTYVVTLSATEITPVIATVRVAAPVPTLSATANGLSATLNLGNLVGDYQYSIDWGDGSTETLTAQGDPNVQLVHPYLQPGTYTIQVTPRNSPPATTTVTVALPPPIVTATANVLTATLNLGNLVQNSTYSVNWGDSATEPLTASDVTAQLTHTYSQPGTFTIQVIPQGGIPVTTTVTLTVPGALLSVLPASAPIRQTVTANLSELSSTLIYTLDWGDNTTDTITGTATSQKTHVYAQPGTYTVTLTSSATTPATATVTTTVPAPTATATSNVLTATLNLSNLLTGYAYSVAWGDGTTEALTPTAVTAQLTHTYTQPGSFTVQVTPQGSTPV
ncbi:PKD domain-containing protein, partial [Deinococcus aquatilis]|uniref:PKD domain-containing protein n=1 Tax=Deinococcus aquatilis TaxID=519440 RepID=UPI0005918176